MRLVILAAGPGSRLRSVTGGRSKTFVEVGGRTLLDRLVEVASLCGMEPLAVVRPEYAADFRAAGVAVMVEEGPTHILDSLFFAREELTETFAWVGGDMLFSDPGPLRELVAEHAAAGPVASFFFQRTDRFKPKLTLEPERRVVVTREPGYALSIPNFLVHSPKVFDSMALLPRPAYLQRLIEAGEPVLIREYPAAVFEIDTPADLDEARRFFQS
jgi:NDP-sugar pyrophosphorylase family protein